MERYLAFLSHGIPAIGFISWGLALFVTAAAHRRNNNESQSLAAKRIEFYSIFLGSSGVIVFHCIVQPTRSYPDVEHISMALPFIIYALALRWKAKLSNSFVNLLGAAAFAQEFILFHWHSTDHKGVEGHYHALLQLIVAACMFTCLGEALFHRKLTIRLLRSFCILFQGVWLLQLALLLVFPSEFLPPDCRLFLHRHQKVACSSEKLIMQSKTVATLLFSWYFSLLMVASAIAYAWIERNAMRYCPVGSLEDEETREL
ncbi:uncharacterized protein LOC112350181 [Selaginella moellendorffii]|uniref:uncharacterized protein LOC112350181 n=1 Tax=Selaginella moellendorffii TaxID=88036 RepID=UPI000D1CCFF2|nr:uncharacterized protein LOC112350181 [Selaginella moellendorffii]|eukprot:XP_024541717.1 uncharacterized protein LOC112350181 [Selaginella moellendorffii]